MLLWQQNMHEFHDALYLEVRWDIARKAFLYAILLYAFIFLPLIISNMSSDSEATTIIVRSDSVPVLFMGARKANGVRSGREKNNQNIVSQKKITAQKKIVEKKKKIEPKKTILKPVQKIKPKVSLKKIEPKKVELPKKSEPSKALLVPSSYAKATADRELKKSELPKSELPKPELPKKPESQKKQEVIQEPEKEIKEQEKKEIEEVFVSVSDEMFGDQEYDVQTKAHLALSRAIGRVWKAPRVKIKQPAHAIIEIDMQGKPVNVELEQKSGALIHDIESRAAALRAEYPQEFWGKKIRIIFGD